MAFRGRGRGRGYRGGGFGFAVEKSFELFPEVELPDPKSLPVDTKLLHWNNRLIRFWKSSSYHLEETVEKKSEFQDIERFSDWKKPETSTRDSIYEFVQMDSTNFPNELVKDLNENPKLRQQRRKKRVRWNPGEIKVEDYFDKVEQKYQDIGEKDEKEKKEDEEEEENDEEATEEDEEFSDDGDYNQNLDFDDDEDDYNMEEEEDEAIF